VKTIQVSCELKQPHHHYTALYDYMQSYDRASHPITSMWLVKTHKSVPQVRDEVRRVVDADDEVLVFDVTGAAWASNSNDTTTRRLAAYARS
jgi:hypothetical protein